MLGQEGKLTGRTELQKIKAERVVFKRERKCLRGRASAKLVYVAARSSLSKMQENYRECSGEKDICNMQATIIFPRCHVS